MTTTNHRDVAVAKASKLHGIKLITVEQVLDLIEAAGLPRYHKGTLHYRMRRGTFPRPFRIEGANLTAYAEGEIRAWLKRQGKLVRVGEKAAA
jgi:predicted DNA-binding transcriptional regulator AlpA